jgi:hypothetical protein
MTSTLEDNDDRLPERAEALLDGWPAPARGALEWEDAASRTMARVRDTEIGSTSDDLLTAPLPPESGEGSIGPAPKEDAALGAPEERLTPVADRITPVAGEEHVTPEPEEEIAATSKHVSTVPPGGQSELANIARAVVSAGSAAASRAVAREVMLAAEERRSVPPRASQRPTAVSDPRPRPVEAAHEAVARSELPAREHQEKRGGLGMILLGGGAALALAAGAAFYVSAQRGDGRARLAETSAEAPRTAASLASPAATTTRPEGEERVNAIALDVLPAASERPPTETSPSKVDVPASGATKDSLAFRVKSAPAGGGKLVLEERNDDTASQQAGAPHAAPSQAGAPQAAPAAPQPPQQAGPQQAAAPPPENPAPQPSLGAVQAAVGSVMSGARSCLAGQDSGSKATVIFGSSGRVTSVHISGPAAGTPAESCVRSALMGARVPPFSDPTFSASLTIRPP